jgi:hypothetical protein
MKRRELQTTTFYYNKESIQIHAMSVLGEDGGNSDTLIIFCYAPLTYALLSEFAM